MSKPTKARTIATRFTLIVVATLLGACSGEVTGPAAAPQRAIEATSMFVPSASAKALHGVADGTYMFSFDPDEDQTIKLGPNRLDIPEDAVCNLGSSDYGAAYWDKPCSPEKRRVTLTVIIKNAASSSPRIDFYPAMRFNPKKNVRLYMYAPKVSKDDAKNWLMFYCPDKGK